MKVQNYVLENEIGAGSFSTVYKAFHKEEGKYYAIKSMREMPRNVLTANNSELRSGAKRNRLTEEGVAQKYRGVRHRFQGKREMVHRIRILWERGSEEIQGKTG